MSAKRGFKANIGTDSSVVILPFNITVGGEVLEFFLNIHKVLRVEDSWVLDLLPKNCNPFSYLYDNEGVPTPVVKLKDWIHGQQVEEEMVRSKLRSGEEKERLLLCSSMGYEIGLLVDCTSKVLRVRNIDLLPPPHALGERMAFISGVYKHKNHYKYMFDPEYLLKTVVDEKIEMEDGDEDNFLKGKHFLLVEDSKFYAHLVAQALKKYGGRVTIARNGREGFDLLMGDHTFDTLITDIEMPMMSGIEMVREFKRQKPDDPLPVIFFSSISNKALYDELREDDLGVCIEKQEGSDIIRALREMA